MHLGSTGVRAQLREWQVNALESEIRHSIAACPPLGMYSAWHSALSFLCIVIRITRLEANSPFRSGLECTEGDDLVRGAWPERSPSEQGRV